MYRYVYSAAVSGMRTFLVRVECDARDGLPSFNMVGGVLPVVREAGERAMSALSNSGFSLKPKKILVNLSPAGLKKEGAYFDLPIAMAVLAAVMELDESELESTAFCGELSLSGNVAPVPSVLPFVLAAKNAGIKRFVLPMRNVKEANEVPGIDIIGVRSLEEAALLLISGFKEEALISDDESDDDALLSDEPLYKGECAEDTAFPDMADIRGQESVKRAVLVAACGMHNLALIGSAGSGKSSIAKRITGILPPLSFEESIEVSKVYGINGLGSGNLIKTPPFRSPLHTISLTGLCGGKNGPGEMALANRGVLFLDELPESKLECIEALREPLEERKIAVSGKNGVVTYPAFFMTVIAANPCPCGFYPDRRRCRCTEGMIKKYMGKISRAVWDRIDITAVTEEVSFEAEKKDKKRMGSSEMRKTVERVRNIQKERFKDEGIMFNCEMDMDLIDRYCRLTEEESDLLKQSIEAGFLSARSQKRVLQVARTLADMGECENIGLNHLAESIHYKSAVAAYIS